VTLGVQHAVVFLDCPGGDLTAAIDIGWSIRQRSFPTALTDNAICSSACAIIWLAGTTRYLGVEFARARGACRRNGTDDVLGSLDIEWKLHCLPIRLNYSELQRSRERSLEIRLRYRGPARGGRPNAGAPARLLYTLRHMP
jgi:hypothetical protein